MRPVARGLTLTVAQAAVDLGLCVTSVRKLIAQRRLQAIRYFPGGDLRIRPADLEAFVAHLETEEEIGLRLVHGRTARRGRR